MLTRPARPAESSRGTALATTGIKLTSEQSNQPKHARVSGGADLFLGARTADASRGGSRYCTAARTGAISATRATLLGRLHGSAIASDCHDPPQDTVALSGPVSSSIGIEDSEAGAAIRSATDQPIDACCTTPGGRAGGDRSPWRDWSGGGAVMVPYSPERGTLMALTQTRSHGPTRSSARSIRRSATCRRPRS